MDRFDLIRFEIEEISGASTSSMFMGSVAWGYGGGFVQSTVPANGDPDSVSPYGSAGYWEGGFYVEWPDGAPYPRGVLLYPPSNLQVGELPLFALVANISYWDYGTFRFNIYGIDSQAQETLIGSIELESFGFGFDIVIPLEIPEPAEPPETCCLRKDTSFSYSPGSPGSPGDPGRQYQPARWVTQTYQDCRWEYSAPDGRVECFTSYDLGAPTQTCYFVPSSGTNTQFSGSYTYVCTTRTRRVFIPEQPYIPPTPATAPTAAQFLTDFNLGWNASARSQDEIVNDGYTEFTIPVGVVGVGAGLNSNSISDSYTDIDYAVVVADGIARLYENGTLVFTLGQYDEQAVFRIERSEGQVIYYVDGDDVYYSATPSSGSLFLDVSLYSGGDRICGYSIVNKNRGDTELLPFVGRASGMEIVFADLIDIEPGAGELHPFAGWGWASPPLGNEGFGTLRPFQVFSRANVNAYTSLAPFQSLGGNVVYGLAETSLRPFTGAGSAVVLAPRFALGLGVLSYFSTTSSGTTGTIGGAETSLLPFESLGSDRVYGESNGSLRPFFGFSNSFEGPDNAFVMSWTQAEWGLVGRAFISVVMNSRGEVESVFASFVELPADLISQAEAAWSLNYESILQAIMMSYASGNSTQPFFSDGQEVWVGNLENQAFSRYEGYPFNSFAHFNGKYYGVSDDGLYSLSSEGDVSAMISLGKHGYNTTWKKRLDACYIGVASSGRVFLKVMAEGREYIYAARASGDPLQVQKIPVGKGIKANYMEFELYNENGQDFEIADIQFNIVRLTRRI